MEQRPFGKTGARLPVVGQGTWQMELADRDAAITALRGGIDAGAVHIDTAEMYGNGAVEKLVGTAIEGRRDEVYVVSKVLPSNASRAGTVAACERSLRRLRTDRLDCYLLHWESSYPLEETVAGFEELRTAGKIVDWGLSNFDEHALSAAVTIAGVGSIACNQVCYHLQERAIEHAVVPYCEISGIAVVAYSPFGSGDFPAPDSPGGRRLAAVATRHGASPRQVAVAFLCRRPAVFAIPKSARVAHVIDNAGAGTLRLDTADIAAIEEAFPRGRRRRLPMI